jgi:pentapeptide MXKDX repeat protein
MHAGTCPAQPKGCLMKKLIAILSTAAFVAVSALSFTGAAIAQDKMKSDKMSSDPMSKDGMSKDKMAKDDKMKKDGMMKKDEMKK